MWVKVAIAGLGFGVGLVSAIGISQVERKKATEEKLQLFWVSVDLAQDIIELQKEIKELRGKRA